MVSESGNGQPPNKLYYGDCLTIMQEMGKWGVDLIYLDPPFNSNRAYNAIYKDETGRPLPDQIEAFCDTWTLDDERERVIRWCYRGGGVPKHDFARKHDVILRYSTGKTVTFNVDAVRIPYSEASGERLQWKARSFRGDRSYDNYEQHPEGKHPEDWWPCSQLRHPPASVWASRPRSRLR